MKNSRKNSNKVTLLNKEYHGFESWADIFRDVSECFDRDFEPEAKKVPGEGRGIMTVMVTYTPSEEDPPVK